MTNWMLVIFGVLIGFGAGVLLLHRLGRHGPRPELLEQPATGAGGEVARGLVQLAKESQVKADPGNVLVQMAGDDMALVFGKDEALDRIGPVESHLPSQVTRLTVGADAAVKAFIAGGEMSGRLVRLTKESARAMRELDKIPGGDGSILGVFRHANGKFAHVARFKDLGRLQAMTSVTGALSAMAVQAQLQRIEEAIGNVDRKVDMLSSHGVIRAQATIQGLQDVIHLSYAVATETGQLTTATWEPIAQLEVPLASALHEAFRHLERAQERMRKLSKGVKDRREELETLVHEEKLLDWLALALEATRLRSAQQALSLWNAMLQEDPAVPTMALAVRAEMQTRADALRTLHDQMAALVAGSGNVSQWRQLNGWRFGKLEDVIAHLAESMIQISSAFGLETQPASALDPGAMPLELVRPQPVGSAPCIEPAISVGEFDKEARS